VLNSTERIAYVSKHGDYYYNFWRDARHVRGIWRRTTLAGYQQAQPPWETIIDLDQLARKMVALMQEQGHKVLYWENMEGGHAGAANNDQQAQMWALTYTFLLNQLN